ncbi:MAG: hypothetical protein ACR2K6_08220 [Solirubrobacterales bacterium]
MTKPRRKARRPLPSAARVTLLAMVALGLVAAGCGASSPESEKAELTADAADFPTPDGRTVEEIKAELGESELVVIPAQQTFRKGTQRVGLGVFELDNTPVPDAEIALYAGPPGEPAAGPFPATARSLAPAAPFRSQTTSGDPEAGEWVYTAEVDLRSKGEAQMLAVVDDAGELSATRIPGVVVDRFAEPPQVGEKAPVINTPTPEDVGGNVSEIDTRQPPSTLHEKDFADVVGTEPAVLLFATPALCTSRVCGPVVDITEEVKAERPDDAAYILMEIFKDNNVEKGVREQVKEYSLQTEPWLFVVDADGVVSTAIEGPFSKQELEEAIDKVAVGS